jgi:hypothetical protein
MSDKGYVPLRERAAQAWKKERPKRVAHLLRRASRTQELREKVKEVFGEGIPTTITTDLHDRPVATIEGFRFTFVDRFPGRRHKSLMLIDNCPRCDAETGFVIDTLTELGQLLEGLTRLGRSSCSECLGLTDEDLKLTTLPRHESIDKHTERS